MKEISKCELEQYLRGMANYHCNDSTFDLVGLIPYEKVDLMIETSCSYIVFTWDSSWLTAELSTKFEHLRVHILAVGINIEEDLWVEFWKGGDEIEYHTL